jgi:O-antigen ligase
MAPPVDSAQERVWHAVSFSILWLLVFCIPWGDMVLLPYDIQFSRLLMVFFSVPSLLLLWRGRRFRASSSTQLFMFMFVVWAGANVLGTTEVERSVRRVLSYGQLFFVAWLVCQLVRSGEDYRKILQAYVIGSYVAFGGLMYNFIIGAHLGDGRYTAPGFDPNDLAATLVLGLPIASYLAFTSQKALWLNGLYVPCVFTAVMLTASRNGLVTLAVSMAFPLLAMPKISLRAKISLLLVGALCTGSVFYFWNDYLVDRLSTISDQLAAGDMNGRVDIWRRGFEVFQENPILGLGGGAFGTAVGSQSGAAVAAHNTFLGVLVEHGVVGLVCFLGIILSLALRSWHSPPLDRRLWIVVLLAWGVSVSTLSWENRELTWLLWGLCSAQPWCKSMRRRAFASSPRAVYA